MLIIPEPHSFEWDEGNKDKNFLKHKVTLEECEEAFYDPHKRIYKTPYESGEDRTILLAVTSSGRILFIVFTVRAHKIRVISARDLNKKERELYEKAH